MAGGLGWLLQHGQGGGSWKGLWKTQVPAKVRMFLWRLSKHSVPTNDVRAHRHMLDTSACRFCGSPDSWKHSLVECTMSRCTWALVDDELAQILVVTSEPNAKTLAFYTHEIIIACSLREAFGHSLGNLGSKTQGHSRRYISKSSNDSFLHQQVH